MTPDARYKKLHDIGQLMLDLKLADLHRAAEARLESLGRLDALRMVSAHDLDPVTAAQTELRYQKWADARRSEINQILARQTVDWLKAQTSAREAFGKADALRLLREKMR